MLSSNPVGKFEGNPAPSCPPSFEEDEEETGGDNTIVGSLKSWVLDSLLILT